MPFHFTNQEYADMHFVYGFCNGNSAEAVREYQRRFPNRRHPHHRVFINIHNNFSQYGLSRRVENNGYVRNRRRDREIVNTFERDRKMSIRKASAQIRISQTTIWRSLRRNHLKPYHYQPLQGLLPGDRPRRLDFCRVMQEKIAEDPQFLTKVIWSDESCFTRRGIVNFHNLHVWSHINPRAIRPRNFQEEFSINVWLGLFGDTVLGPYILPQRLNGNSFLDFLETRHHEMLENIPLNERQDTWFQLDGCPAHYARNVRTWLDGNYPRRWIGRGGFIAWPARSPDLTPLDFFAWGYLKQMVYSTPVTTRDELAARIENARATIGAIHLRRAQRSLVRRYELCIEHNGGHFQQFLHS